jgi:hypothetical protein
MATRRQSRREFTELLHRPRSCCNRRSVLIEHMCPPFLSAYAGSSHRAIHRCPRARITLCAILSGISLVVTSCGDFQDPSSGEPVYTSQTSRPQGEEFTGPSGFQDPLQTPRGGERRTSEFPSTREIDSGHATAPASMTPGSSDTFGTAPTAGSPNTDLLHSGTSRPPTDAGPRESPWSSPDDSQLGSATWDIRPELRSVTLNWDPSPSHDALGYKVYLIAISTSAQQAFDTGPATELQVTLPPGESYYFTVTGYNAAGEGPPAPYFRFDLF